MWFSHCKKKWWKQNWVIYSKYWKSIWSYKVQIISAKLLPLLQISCHLNYTCTKLCHFVTEKAVYCDFILCKLSVAQNVPQPFMNSLVHIILPKQFTHIYHIQQSTAFFQNLGCKQEISLACEEMLNFYSLYKLWHTCE